MMTAQQSSPASLGRLFSNRLRRALDQMGFPANTVDRARALAKPLDLDESTATSLLNGALLPDWELFISICGFTKSQPGFFLDESINQYPPDTRVVKPLISGENIVVRLPPKVSRDWGPASAEWTYLETKAPMGFGILANDYIVNFACPAKPHAVHVDTLYLIGVRNSFEVRTCVEVAKGRAVLAGDKEAEDATEFLILPVVNAKIIDHDDMHVSGIFHFGEIASLIRGPETMVAACV